MTHKHAEVLKAILDGARFPEDFEWQNLADNNFWQVAVASLSFQLIEGRGEFRLKPVPKPDIVKTMRVYLTPSGSVFLDYGKANTEFTFTADGDLKAVGMLP